jgi:hypothetical protein
LFGISSVAEQLAASQEGLSSMEIETKITKPGMLGKTEGFPSKRMPSYCVT